MKLVGDTLEILGEFPRFVRPVDSLLLSDFCMELTSISQEDVDDAEPYNIFFPELLAWIDGDKYKIASWGNYDLRQFWIHSQRHNIHLPERFKAPHNNLKKESN